MAVDDPRKRLMMIRRLASIGQESKFERNLDLIAKIATGEAEPAWPKEDTPSDLAERLAAGLASRSPRNAADIVARNKRKEAQSEESDPSTERSAKGTRDRKEKPRMNRTTDVNV